jgi:hypothetical protein
MESPAQDQKAIVLLIKQIMDQIDEIASLRKQGKKAGISRELLGEMCSILPELSEAQRDHFHDLLIKLTQHSESSATTHYSSDYAEYSISSKRRFLTQIRTELKLAVNN